MNSSGTHVVLPRFPTNGTLSVFGLTASKLRYLAIPNDLREWPLTALDNCTNLEQLAVHGAAANEGGIELTFEHNLSRLTNLTSIQLPSTVTSIRRIETWNYENTQTVVPKGICSITFSKRLKKIGARSFVNCKALSTLDFSRCQYLEFLEEDIFFYCSKITTVDFSKCAMLTSLGWSLFDNTSITTLILPPSLKSIQDRIVCTYPAPLELLPTFKVLIWEGRNERLPILDEQKPAFGICSSAFGRSIPLPTLVDNGIITEVFLP